MEGLLEAIVQAAGTKNNSFHKIIDLRKEVDRHISNKQFKTANYKCEEIMQEVKILPGTPNRKILFDTTLDLIYSIRGKYIEKKNIKPGTFVDAKIEFLIEETICGPNGEKRKGDPGFSIYNDEGIYYNCHIKEMPDLKVGDRGHCVRIDHSNLTSLNYE